MALIVVAIGIDNTGIIPDMPPDSESPAATRRSLPPPPELDALLSSEQRVIKAACIIVWLWSPDRAGAKSMDFPKIQKIMVLFEK